MTMRANLRNGKLVPPRSYEHAARRMQQLRHELKGIIESRLAVPGALPGATEQALRDEAEQLAKWMEVHK